MVSKRCQGRGRVLTRFPRSSSRLTHGLRIVPAVKRVDGDRISLDGSVCRLSWGGIFSKIHYGRVRLAG
ncbi:hypothetical protein Rcae01_02168 [Novipirellula caenicola]|uniref:Uncharacterized protein n=1 Tax=Novipirellula caenicola TaxID=1536901 RepID=A0ABP9VNE8_9BACT